MKRTLAIVLFILMACSKSKTQVPEQFKQENGGVTITYTNPIATEFIRDPQINYVDGKYYMTGTCEPFFEHLGQNPGVKLWSSDNFVNWKFEHLLVTPDSWYQQRFWAPEIFPYKGKFYLTFNCFGTNPDVSQSVGLAVADKITGPYQVLTKDDPLCEGNDASLFEDEDGKVYLFTAGLFGQQIDLEKVKLIGEKIWVLQVGPKGTWDGGAELGVGIEGPGVIKKNGTYYLFYSSWGRGYEVGYATAKYPLGPYTKSTENPVYGAQEKAWAERYGNIYSQSPGVPFAFVGHGQPFKASDGSFWLSSHGIKPGAEMEPRLMIDPLNFGPDGIVKIKMSWTKQTVVLKEKNK